MAGKRYWCRKCSHKFWFEEHTVGAVPDRCPACGNHNFDNAYKARGREGNQRNWTTNVWDGAVLSDRAYREWDF